MLQRSAGVCFLALMILFSQQVLAKEEKWSLTPIFGIHKPKLEALNEGEFKSPFLGVGVANRPDIPGEDPQQDERPDERTQFAFGGDIPLEPLGAAANLGLEFQWQQNDKHVFLFGVSSWEASSSNSIFIKQLPLQGTLHEAILDRRAKMSYNEYYLGWRFNVVNRPKKYKFYTRFSLHELFDIDYREDLVFSLLDQPNLEDSEQNFAGVKRIFILKPQTTGVLMLQAGIGGEYFLRKNFSISFEGGYAYQPQPFTFTSMNIKEDMREENDGWEYTGTPLTTDSQGRVHYIAEGVQPSVDWSGGTSETARKLPATRQMRLTFDGWKAAYRISFYF